MIDFLNAKSIFTPKGEVASIARGAEILWQKLKLPVEYQEVDYIESTGTQWIDTGLRLNQNSKLEMLISHFDTNGNRKIFGSRTSATKNSFGVIYGPVGGIMHLVADFDNYTNNRLAYVVDGNEFIEISISKEKLKINDSEKAVSTYGNFTTPENAYLFNCSGTYSASLVSAEMRLYYCKIYDNGVPVRDFIPCYRKSDGEVGLYDTVTETFFTNAGTGEFVCEKPKYKTELAYLESTGEQYIITDYYPSNKSRVVVNLKFNTTDIQQRVFSSVTSAYNFDMYINKSGYIAFNAGTTRSNTSVGVKRDTNWHKYEIDQYTAKLDGRVLKTLSASVGQCSHPMLLFARRADDVIAYSDYPTKARIGAVEVYEDVVLLHNIIPVLDWDDRPCMYDKVTDELFYNQGTGEFVYA